MIQDEIEKNAVCPVCLQSLTTALYFTPDDYPYHKKCFNNMNFKCPISRQDFYPAKSGILQSPSCVCLFVCLFVSRISQKRPVGF